MRNDDIPETDEIFSIKLLSVLSSDGEVGSTNTSGASMDPSKASVLFTILKNDHSNGVLQFTNRTIPPTPDEGILPVDSETPVVRYFSLIFLL